ncbi:MAG TPA: leucyl aminopeptidase [Chloroflexota bacterium]|nr:leucyl aminopeptidase [Chloroflexota bacterium]
MDIRIATSSALDLPVDVLVVPALEQAEHSDLLKRVDARLGGRLQRARELKELTGKLYEANWLHTDGAVPAPRVLTVGIGEWHELDVERVRRAATVAGRALRRREVKRAAVVLPPFDAAGDRLWVVGAFADGLVTSDFDNAPYKTADRNGSAVESVELGVTDGAPPPEWAAQVRKGVALGEAANFARSLAVEPGNRLTPTRLAERAVAMAGEQGLEAEVLDRARLQELGAGALLGVAQGSDEPPVLIVLRRRAGPAGGPVLAIVGKGVTFDSGGISIKPAGGMHEMKFDMSGAAAAIGAMRAIAQLEPKLDVVGLMPCVENMVSGRSMRPGDVLTAMNGRTIEVTNTDAEGRLILADALVYAHRLGATHAVDAATLTGGVVTALGHTATGLFAQPDEWAQQVLAAAERGGERTWRLPLYPEYRELLKSDVADIGNSGGRAASPCTGATFIKEFVAEGMAWAHLDIAGTAWTTSDKPWMPSGPTGAGLRTFVELALGMARPARS